MAYRIKATVSYDGKNYCGWQKQIKDPTIQGKIEQSLRKLHGGTEVLTYGASRTDAGVHANNQVFHYDTKLEMTESKWKIAINNYLPNDIYIKTIEFVNEDFHARFNVVKKRYRYFVNTNDFDPLLRNRMSFERRILDLALMEDEVKKLIGKHNFKSFTGSSVYDNYVRVIMEASIIKNDGVLEFTFVGNGFMRYMVRTMVGTLVEIGYGRKKDINEILLKEDRKSTRLNSSHQIISYAVFCLKKKKKK